MTERLTKDNDDFDWETANFMLGRIEAIVYQCTKKNKSHSKGIIEIGAVFQENDPDWFEKLDNLWEDEESGNQSSTPEESIQESIDFLLDHPGLKIGKVDPRLRKTENQSLTSQEEK